MQGARLRVVRVIVVEGEEDRVRQQLSNANNYLQPGEAKGNHALRQEEIARAETLMMPDTRDGL